MQKTVRPIRTGEEYIESLKGRNLKVYLFGELVKEPVDHPIIRPSINAVAKTYDLAVEEEDLASAKSSITGERVNPFLTYRRKCTGCSFTKQDATKARSTYWYLLPKMCRYGCTKLTSLYYV